nr:hypothetical protein Y50E8A.h - Caenorhabditis elegans [Caenorhabditis elegans]
MVGSHREKF